MHKLIMLLIALGPAIASAQPNQCADVFKNVDNKNAASAPESTNAQQALSQVFEASGLKIASITSGEASATGAASASESVADIIVKDPKFYGRVLSDPMLELGETYMDGMWESNDIDQVTYKLMSTQMRAGQLKTYAPLWRAPHLATLAVLRHGYRYFRDRLTNRQTRVRSKTVAEEHYDAGNELYRRMLDPTLTYTSGVWAPGYDLEDSQNAKYDLIARKLNLKPGQHVLDIGSGFGGFARFAAKNYGAKVTGITISVEQLKAAKELSSGMPGVNFVFSDYRDIPNRFPPNTFDHVVSIEMIEAVGQKNLEEYFKAANASLKDGGRFVVQAIASNKDVVNSNAWFSKYIFHDGVAPSTNQVDRAAESTFGSAVDRHRITADYDKTLMVWHENFTRAWPELKNEYSDRFKRMWDFYLLSVAGGFRAAKVQLDQAVFVKGAHRNEVAVVRELPSRQRLDAMKLTKEQNEMTAVVIGDLEVEKRAMKEAIKPRPHAMKPLAKDARIAVIGAGPGGLSSALELKKLGYANVTVFEKNDEAGGKSHTVSLNGRNHDLGATMGVKFKYAEIEKLAKEQGQTTVNFPKQIDYDLATGKRSEKPPVAKRLALALQGILYLVHHARISGQGERGLEVPAAELADPWSVVMNRHGLSAFGDKMKTYLTGYGYGGPETPAVFGHRMLSVDAILGAALSKPIMWENGTQPIWKGVAKGLNVRTGTPIDRIDRNGQNVVVHTLDPKTGVAKAEAFDRIVMAVDPQTALRTLDSTPEERALFSQVQYMPYATFAVRVDGVSDGKAEVGYLRENMTLDKMGRPMAWIKRYADDNVFVFHLFAPAALSDEQIMANIGEDMRKLGAKKTTLVDSRRWPFFPHVDAVAMREKRFYERAANLQGLNKTVFVNESLAMSTMPDSAELGRKVAERLASGEYDQ